jgi:hypothetical protein
MSQEYRVGYKKPPVEHQFKAGDASRRKWSRRKAAPLDLAKRLSDPYKIERGGKTIAIHPLEAAVISLVRAALKGNRLALKKVLRIFEAAGLIKAPPARQTHGVLTIPKGFTWPAFSALMRALGQSGLDSETIAAVKIELAQDKAKIDLLYEQFRERTDA